VTIPLTAMLMVPREGGNATVIFLVQMVAIFAIFYFLLIRPQTKERDRHQEVLNNLGKGDEIVTNGGIIGTIVHTDEHRLTVRTAENTRITIDRSRIAGLAGVERDEEE